MQQQGKGLAMLNEEKVRYMTELAIFEKNQGKEIFSINRYFKSDYVGIQMFRSFFGYTFSYLLILVLWILYKLEDLLGAISLEEAAALAALCGFWYLAGLAVYLLISCVVARRRYSYASRYQIMYSAKLKHLLNRYGKADSSSYKGGKS